MLGEPLGFFVAQNGRRYNILGAHVKQYLAEACFLAHPDENHYLRIHINTLVAHSFRVTAAVALHTGVPIDVITVRLRWNSDAVKVYLRDSETLARTLSFQGYAWRLCRQILYNDAPLRVHVKLFYVPTRATVVTYC